MAQEQVELEFREQLLEMSQLMMHATKSTSDDGSNGSKSETRMIS